MRNDDAYETGNLFSQLPGLGHSLEIGRDGENFSVRVKVEDGDELSRAVPDFADAVRRQREGALIEAVLEILPDEWEAERDEIIERLNTGGFGKARELAASIREAEVTGYGSDIYEFAPSMDEIDEKFHEIMEKREMDAVISRNGASLSVRIAGSYPDSGYEFDGHLLIYGDTESVPAMVLLIRDGESAVSAAERFIADIRADDDFSKKSRPERTFRQRT